LFGRKYFKFDRAFIFEMEKAEYKKPAANTELTTNYQIRIAFRDEMPAVSLIAGVTPEESYRRFDNSNICFGVFEGSRPANINWALRGSCYVKGTGYIHRAGIDDYYIYGIVTDPAERGKGLYQRALIDMADYLFSKGANKLIQMAQDGNSPVLHSLPKLGYKLKKEIIHYRFLGVKYTVTRDFVGNRRHRDFFITPPKELFYI